MPFRMILSRIERNKQMNLKKLGVLLVAAAFVVSAGAGTADAAKGGAKLSSPKVSAPKASTPKATKPEASTKKEGPNNKEYAPSKKADQYKETAPAAKSNTNAASNAAANAQKSTGWGSAMRTMGMLAGGMLLGSMLSHLFGFGGTGLFADIMGVVMNLAIIAAVICLLNFVVRRFVMGRLNKGNQESVDARGNTSVRDRYVEERPVQDIRAKTIDAEPIQDIKPPASVHAAGRDYEPHSMAERYRNM